MDPNEIIAALQRKVAELTESFEALSFSFWKKTGPAPNGISNTDLESTNFVTGSSGWRLDADGNLEANNGNFRGDITGASGTFSGTVSVGSLNIPDSVTANSMHVDSSGNTWWGATVASGYANAPAYVLKDGTAVFGTVSAGNISFDGTKLVVSDSKIINTFTAQENISAGDAVCIGDGTTIDTEPYTGVGSSTTITTTDWIAQQYTSIIGSVTLTRVIIAMAASVNGNYSITLSVRANSAGAPTGSDLVSKTQTCALTTSQVSVNFDFSSAMTTASQTSYHIVVRRAASEGNTVSVGRDNNASQGTNTSANSGSSWSAANGGIRLEVTETDSVSGQVSKTSASSTHARANNFIGFAFETKTAGQSIRIALSLIATGLSSLTPGSTYYLSNTLGAIATSAGTATRKIGVALSSTSLLIKHDNV